MTERTPTARLLTAALVCAALAGMTGIAAYSVTLYRLFCQVTGAGGTTQRAIAAPAERGRFITVLFDTTTAPNLDWRFAPVQRRLRLRLGEEAVAFFTAENLSRTAITGRATFNVTPEKTGLYFKKIHCFCFDDQRLEPGQKASMPVSFFVDPRLADDPNTAEVQEITLSYTFFRSLKQDDGRALASLDAGTPPSMRGQSLFAAQCAGCHGLDHAAIGPALAGVYGRQAGTSAGYPYSAALARSGVIWESASLDRWLAGPQAMLPGALMPMRVSNAADRAALIAYLRTLSP